MLINVRTGTKHWRDLNLHVRTFFRSLTFDLVVPAARPHAPRASLTQVCIALLANMPATVRVLALKLRGLDVNWQAEIENATSLGLHALDAALAKHGHSTRVEIMINELHGSRS